MLCKTCELLNLSSEDFIIQANENKASFEQYHDIGPLSLIREKSPSCALCRLIVMAIGGSQQPSTKQDRDIQCQLYWQEDGFLSIIDEPQVRCLRVSANPWPPSYNEYNRLIPLLDGSRNSNGVFLGRKIKESSVDIKLIKKWVRLCLKWHGDDCEEHTASPQSTFPPSFRVIDAWDRCIVTPPEQCRYLALSYVWGTANVFKLTASLLPALLSKGGLSRIWHTLPKTIQDSITLTSLLCIRYIWIDSLCIIQDDPVDKQTLIPYMHMVYDRAFMTFVAAAGKDAHAGLSGIRPTSRARTQAGEKMSPGLRLISPQHVVDGLNQSVYESRGWTYQEGCFSRRCLIFFDNLVMFRCRRELWREDVYLENINVQSSFDMTFKHSIKGVTATDEVHQDYAGSLYEYSSRRLTHDSDTVNAFTGVLNTLCERMRGEQKPELDHVYGLPTRIFDWAILWQPNISGRRRPNGWPSWSWCGWIGTIAMALSNVNASELEQWLTHRTWIRWTIYDLHGEVLMHMPSETTYSRVKEAADRFQCLNIDALTGPEAATRAKALIYSSSLTYSCSTSSVHSHLLHFATLSLRLRLEPTTRTASESGGQPSSSARSYIIHYHTDSEVFVPYGTIWLDASWRLDPDPTRTYEFLVLSEAPRRQALNKEFSPRAVLSGPASHVDIKWAAYFVMLIERDLPTQEIAERVGLGVVYREAIDVALTTRDSGAAWKEIWLR